jgi:hypothetical protein
MITKTLFGTLFTLSMAASSVHASGFGEAFAGGVVGGIVGGALAQRQPRQVVVVKEHEPVVHEHVVHHYVVVHHDAPATSAPVMADTTHAVNSDTPPSTSTQQRITPQVMEISTALDMPEHMKALATSHQAAISFVADYLKKVDPTKTLADVSLFQYVKIGAFNYLIAKAQINTSDGAMQQGIVIDLSNNITANLQEPVYRDFLHSGNVNLLGEHPLNPLD